MRVRISMNFSVFLSKSKNKLKIKNELIEKHKNMNEDFEQSSYSNSAAGIYKIGHVSIRIMKWLAYYDECSENIIHFDLMGSFSKYSNDIS